MSFVWAWRSLIRQPLRSGLALLGIGVAAALLLDMLMLSGGIERSFERLLLSRGYQIRITPGGTLPFDTEATFGDVDSMLQTVRTHPGVAEAGAVLGFAVHADSADARMTMIGYGIEPQSQGIYRLEEGVDLNGNTDLGVLLSTAAARALDVTAGDTVTLSGQLDPQAAAAFSTMRTPVRGVVTFLYDARRQPSAALALPLARRLAGDRYTDRASVVMVRATEDDSATAVANELDALLPGVSVAAIDQLVVQFRGRLTYFRQLALVLATISLTVAVLLIGTLLALSVNERRAEFATMRAVGISRATIMRQVLAQAALMTFTGTVIGTALGLATARQLDAILTTFPGLPASVSFFVAAPEPLLLGALVLASTGLLAGVWPAWHAANSPIALTLREDVT